MAAPGKGPGGGSAGPRSVWTADGRLSLAKAGVSGPISALAFVHAPALPERLAGPRPTSPIMPRASPSPAGEGEDSAGSGRDGAPEVEQQRAVKARRRRSSLGRRGSRSGSQSIDADAAAAVAAAIEAGDDGGPGGSSGGGGPGSSPLTRSPARDRTDSGSSSLSPATAVFRWRGSAVEGEVGSAAWEADRDEEQGGEEEEEEEEDGTLVLLAACGPYLELYNPDQLQGQDGGRSKIATAKAWAAGTVHGLVVLASGFVLVFGQKQVALVRVTVTPPCNGRLQVIARLPTLDDWVLDVACLAYDLDNLPVLRLSGQRGGRLSFTLAVIHAHNHVTLWSWKRSTFNGTVEVSPLARWQCAQRCMLYSAKFFRRKSELLLGSGTVFGEVLLWFPLCGKGTGQDIEVAAAATGHEGSIFGLSFSPDGRRLASISDDRTVRIWDISGIRPGRTSDLEVLHVLFGHTAKIYNCHFISNELLLSAGADECCLVWDQLGKCVERIDAQRGTIWSLATVGPRALVATGQASGSLRLWVLRHNLVADAVDQSRLLNTVEPGEADAAGWHRISMYAVDRAVVASKAGRLYDCDLKTGVLQLRAEGELVSRYCELEANGQLGVAAMSSIEGHISVFDLHTIDFGGRLSFRGHERQIIFLAWGVDPTDTQRHVLFSSDVDGIVKCWAIRCERGGGKAGATGDTVALEHTLLGAFEVPRKGHVQAAALLSMDGGGQFVCGDRNGQLHLMCCRAASEDTQGKEPEAPPDRAEAERAGAAYARPTHSLAVHHKRSVTSLLCKDGKVVSAGRDGYVCEYERVPTPTDDSGALALRLHCTAQHRPVKGVDWLARFVPKQGNKLLALAFVKTRFVVWDEADNDQILSIECGGGHRTWGFWMDPISHDFCFAFVRNDAIHVHVGQLGSLVTRLGYRAALQEDWHNREVVSSCFMSSSRGPVLFRAGEDNNMSATLYDTWTGRPLHMSNVQVHFAGVRALVSLQTGTDSAIVVSGGGQGAIKVWEALVGESYTRMRLVCQWPPPWAKKFQIDGRIMGLSARLVGEGRILLAAAVSDATFRVFGVDLGRPYFIRLAQTDFHHRCVVASAMSLGEQHELLFSAGTDGRIAVWDARAARRRLAEPGPGAVPDHGEPVPLGGPLLAVSCHQNGVNGLSVEAVGGVAEGNGTRLVLVSCGDDNAVNVHVLGIQGGSGGGVRLLHEILIDSAHSASATGIARLPGLRFATVSADCRLQVWRVCLEDNEKAKLCTLAESYLLDIYDPQTVSYSGSRRGEPGLLVVGGVGTQVLRTEGMWA